MRTTPEPGGAEGTALREGLPEPQAWEPLRKLYRGYRRRQITGLLSLLPDGAIRPLYRAARRWALERDLHDDKDPFSTLVRYCDTVLPLPPFSIWLEDFRQHGSAHLKELDQAPAAADEGVPVTLDVRSLVQEGCLWYAALSVFRREGAWRGYVTFRAEASNSSVRTADIFRSQDPTEIRNRFRRFDGTTLAAFLRSTLP